MTGKLSTYNPVTTLSGPETFTAVVTPNGGSDGTKKITASDLAIQLAALGAYAADADITGLDARLDVLEHGGIFKSVAATSTPLVSNANTYVDLATSGAMAPSFVAAGDTVAFDYQGDMLNNSGGSIVYDFQMIVGAFQLFVTPSAGVSVATNAARRTFHAWAYLTFVNATTINLAAGISVTSPLGASPELSTFNGATTYLGTLPGITDAAINTANSMTVKLQGKTRTSSASADVRTTQYRWGISPAAP